MLLSPHTFASGHPHYSKPSFRGYPDHCMSSVSLQGRNIARVDAVALQLQPDTRSLDLSRNRIVKIDALDALANLQVLNLSFNRLVKVEGLGGLRLLQVINVSNNSLRDFGCLAQCVSLQEMYAVHSCCTASHRQLLTLFLCTPESIRSTTRGDLVGKMAVPLLCICACCLCRTIRYADWTILPVASRCRSLI